MRIWRRIRCARRSPGMLLIVTVHMTVPISYGPQSVAYCNYRCARHIHHESLCRFGCPSAPLSAVEFLSGTSTSKKFVAKFFKSHVSLSDSHLPSHAQETTSWKLSSQSPSRWDGGRSHSYSRSRSRRFAHVLRTRDVSVTQSRTRRVRGICSRRERTQGEVHAAVVRNSGTRDQHAAILTLRVFLYFLMNISFSEPPLAEHQPAKHLYTIHETLHHG
ncbi:hypothetical protein EDD15DRAFT_1920530 [Pisolithus albus]|nr:hypothetical protein EDD15DRAFT_1920530 [Pisolithus albus]